MEWNCTVSTSRFLPGFRRHSPIPRTNFATRELTKISALNTTKLYLAVVLALYSELLALEGVGLWAANRWAAYLTLNETGVFVLFEIYEVTKPVPPLKVLVIVINVVVVSYLLMSERLCDVLGGEHAELRAREVNPGWHALDRTCLRVSQIDPTAEAFS
jgi:uncharacterized membrane protein (DUF2068 family)